MRCEVRSKSDMGPGNNAKAFTACVDLCRSLSSRFASDDCAMASTGGAIYNLEGGLQNGEIAIVLIIATL